MRTLYNYIVNSGEKITLEYLIRIREYELFKPIFEILDVIDDTNNENNIYLSNYSEEIIKFIVFTYSKESEYNKISDTLFSIQERVMKDLKIPGNIQKLITDFSITQVEEVISNYINRETDEFVRSYLTARKIHALNLTLSASIIDRQTGTLIDPRMQQNYFDAAEKFQIKMYEMKQQFMKENYNLTEMINNFRKNTGVKGLHIEDIIPL